MKAENLLQSKLDKVKSFIDNESFVFTFPRTNAFAIHKDQLFKNQLYNTTIGSNGLEINTRKSSDVIKNEKIVQILTNISLYNSVSEYGFLYDSGRALLFGKDGYTELTLADKEINVNGIKAIRKNKIIKILNIGNHLYLLSNNNEVYEVEIGSSSLDMHLSYTNIKNIFIFGNNLCGLTIENKLIVLVDDGLDVKFFKSDDENNLVEYDTNLKYLKDIKPYFVSSNSNDNMYIFIFENGKSIICSLNANQLEDNPQYLSVYISSNKKFKSMEVENTSGYLSGTNSEKSKTHILILTKDGRVFGEGNNIYHQIGNNYNDNNLTELKFGDMRFKNIKATSYGSILLSTTGKLVVCGTFVNGELGIYNNNSTINIGEASYQKSFVSDKLVMISKSEVLDDGEYKLRSVYNLKLFDEINGGVLIVREDGKLYYAGINNGICGPVFGYGTSDKHNIDVWTPVESNINDIGRITTPRPDYWSYYFDYIMKMDKNGGGNSVENIFFKIDDIWIDWGAYISKYMNVTLRDENNKILKKYKEFKKTDNSVLRRTINFDSFIEYLKLNKESIINEFKVDRTLIPQVDYIDKDLNVYNINAGDNISCIKYSQKDIDFLNADLIESLNHNIQLKNEYESVIEKSQDPEEILEYQNRLAVIKLNIEDLNKEITNNQNKLGTMNSNNYLDFNNNRIFNPMTVVDTVQKTINYSKSNFSEPDEYGEVEIETEERDGSLHVVKSTVTKTVESNVTRLKIDLINYDRLNSSSISDAEVLRDDIKMTIMEDPNDERNFEVDDLLVWLNGKFITKDYIIGNDNKAFCDYNGLSEIETRRICEFPGLGEPTQNSNNIPTISGENATVIEPTIPTELRWNLSTKVFSWENVKINGPYKIHDLNNVNSELRRVEFFYFGDVYCSVFTQFLIKNKKCPKNTFILFFDGAVVHEDEYDVTIKGNNTYITLKTFTAYVASLLQDMVDVMKPGYEGSVRQILSQFDNMSQFSIAFLSSTDKFKKVKMYYDYQTIRDVPKPGQIIFNDIKYNDLILIDGYYVPYLWESRHCIRIPETANTIRSSENSFIHHSTICRVRPYSTYKKESELTDTECRMYAKQNGLINDEEMSSMDIIYIRERVKPHIEARIKEI